MVIDRHTLLIGSMNLDPRSRSVNTEVGLLIESATLGAQVGVLFDQGIALEQAYLVRLATEGDPASALIWEDAWPVNLRREPLASWWRRLLSNVLGAVTPQALL